MANKIRAIWKLIISRQYLLIYDDGGDGTAIGGGRASDLHDVMYMTIQLKQTYNQMIKMLEEASVEMGEAHALKEMRETIQKLEKE